MCSESALPPFRSAFCATPQPANAPARERNLLATAFEEPERPANALAAREGDDAPENASAPPIWRRIESLIEEHRAATRTRPGDAPGEDALIEPAPPIWHGALTPRIAVAEMEGVAESAGEARTPADTPAPPIWRAVEVHRRAGLERASSSRSLADSSHEYEEPRDLSELASAPPIWTTWLSDAWPEAAVAPAGEDVASAEARSVWSEPPIWASHMRKR